ncbi:restriction endonuclease subunit S [Haemophilus influenzae]|uniref:restriction endonuclease subunit S n=1 Tax=Haemophilus influenzae TaxID=727 RepID=UPI000667FE42|nr:restriction endonuclease subunit S [Haemophilus influenzae]
MSDWKCYQLKNLGVIKTGKTPPSSCKDAFSNTGVPFVTPKDMNGVKTIFKTERYLSKIGLDLVKNYLVPKNSIAVSCIGSDMGKAYLLSEDSVTNQQINTLIVNKNHNFEFIYYKLSIMQDYLKSIAGGSATPILNKSHFSEIEIELPDLDTQNNFVEKLKYLDKKIQLNTQINQTLEQIAQALFKSWFVDFDPVRAKVQALSDGLSLEQAELAAMQAISGKTPEELTALSQTQPDRYAELAETAKAFPCEMVEVDGVEAPKGWEKTTLSEICEMQNGYAFKSSDWMEQGIPVIKIGSVKPMIVEVEGNGFVSEDYSKLKPDFLLTSGDILVGLTGYVGEVGRIPTGKIAMLNQRVAKFLPKEIDKNHCFYNYIYCLARQSQFKEFAEINAKGSAQANISTKELLKFPIIKANDKLHILFENRVKELLERILWNSQNAETLAKTRDLLLPRLLNGE